MTSPNLYRNLARRSDEALLRIAQSDVDEYTPEAIEIAVEELRVRGVPLDANPGPPPRYGAPIGSDRVRDGLARIFDWWSTLEQLIIVAIILAAFLYWLGG